MAIITLNNNSLSSVTSLPAAISTGKVLQAVTGNQITSGVNTTSGSYVDSGLYVNITPSSTSSKILVSANFNARQDTANGGTVSTIYRDSTTLSSSGTITYSAGGNIHDTTFIQHLDSPSTTSQIAYKLYFYRFNSTGTAYIAGDWGGARMFALEIGA
tara:strand:- start:233 stop:706 length:474 start_codon:yes stop_codon:yes gene_type:complete